MALVRLASEPPPLRCVTALYFLHCDCNVCSGCCLPVQHCQVAYNLNHLCADLCAGRVSPRRWPSTGPHAALFCAFFKLFTFSTWSLCRTSVTQRSLRRWLSSDPSPLVSHQAKPGIICYCRTSVTKTLAEFRRTHEEAGLSEVRPFVCAYGFVHRFSLLDKGCVCRQLG